MEKRTIEISNLFQSIFEGMVRECTRNEVHKCVRLTSKSNELIRKVRAGLGKLEREMEEWEKGE